MTHGPGLTYDLAVSKMVERNRVGTDTPVEQPSRPQNGRLRMSLGTMLISVGEWLGGSARVTPAAGTN